MKNHQSTSVPFAKEFVFQTLATPRSVPETGASQRLTRRTGPTMTTTNTAKIHRTKIFILQKRANVFGGYKPHAIPFFISSGLLPLGMLYFKSVTMMMNKLPPNIYILFTHQPDIHLSKTRSSLRGDFFLKRIRIIINMSRRASRRIRPSRFPTNTPCSVPSLWLLPRSSTRLLLSFSTVLLQVIFGLPLALRPSGVHPSISSKDY